jgi:ABC-2 type transport system permease protein
VSGVVEAGGAGIRGALHAEWTKLRTTSGAAWLLLGCVAVTVGLSAAATAACDGTSCGGDTTRLGLTGVQLGQAVVAVLAVQAISGEYATRLIGLTLTAVPRRLVALAAKALTVTGVVLAAGVVSVLGCVLVGGLDLTEGPTLRAAAGSVLYLALIGLLSLGIATAVRDSAASLGTVLGLLYLFPIIAGAVTNPDLKRHLMQIGPMNAGLAIQATTGLDALPIHPWPGLGVLAAWAGAALLAGGQLLRVRDA